MTQKILLIDDSRNGNYVIARTYDAGIYLLTSCQWDILYLDHDLGCFIDGKEYTGYNILCWLEENHKYLPGKIMLITSNGAVREKMQNLINKLYNS
jgi:citrate synthase